jgi:hypothetical protein
MYFSQSYNYANVAALSLALETLTAFQTSNCHFKRASFERSCRLPRSQNPAETFDMLKMLQKSLVPRDRSGVTHPKGHPPSARAKGSSAPKARARKEAFRK